MEDSHEADSTQIDSLTCDLISNKEDLAKLLGKNDWEVSDLQTVDCWLQNASAKTVHPLKGLIYYVGGMAYHKFDDDERERLFQKAFVHFDKVNDVEGKFFSLTQLFNSKLKRISPTTIISRRDLSKLYKEIAQIAKETNYVPVKLSLYESELRKKIELDETITEAELVYISDYASQHCTTYPNESKDLFFALGILYQKKGNTNLALKNFYKAKAHTKTSYYDVASYYTNLGNVYYTKQDIDSAKYYFKTSYDLLSKMPETTYQLESKSFVENKLGLVYDKLSAKDSALYYMRQSLQTKNEQMELQLDINRVYAEKKFENKKNELRLSKIENELLDKKRILAYLSTIFSLAIIIIGILFILHQRKKRKQLAKLAKDRERLFRIINHDLNSPLQVFSNTASPLPKLIAKKKFAEVEEVQKSLSLTSIALQNTINNLFAWSLKMIPKPEKQNPEEKNIAESIEEIVAAYKDLAGDRGIDIETNLAPNLVATIISMKLGNLARNIIYNAIQHGETQSTIYIGLEMVDENKYCFSCDNRVSHADIDLVKNLVKIINSRKKEGYKNLGLGMELIFDAIESHDGFIVAKLEDQKFSISCIISQ